MPDYPIASPALWERFSIRPSKDEINSLPVLSYSGKIFLVETKDQLHEVLPLLNQEKVLGFDTEARPSFRKGKIYPTSLLQLSGADVVALIRLNYIGLPLELAQLLSNSEILKVGVAIADDIKALQKLQPFEPKGMVDLARLALQLKIESRGLRTLTASLLRGRIIKTAQCSNWDSQALSQAQQIYAATDAWIGRELYLFLEQLQCSLFDFN